MMGSLTLYARAALPLIPGASRLPFVAGRGSEMPQLERRLDGVAIDCGQLADYAHTCGFGLRDVLPATYLHVRAFPLHMAVMTDGRFPFPAVGLVHLSNRIVVHRPAAADERFDLHVRTTPIEPHPKGRTFAIVSEARVGGELVWEDVSTMLKRGEGSDAARPLAEEAPPLGGAGATWRLAGDLGRRYGAVSGDRNPIHLHALTARAFGFPRAIAHGMWTKAACLAALDPQLPAAYTVDVTFRKPILLPGVVTFAEQQGRFAVRAAKDPDTIHLEGTVTP
ncbi:MAG: MaoC/PaaZ C-terminal domain-containing protein [Conexibacter sp.]